MATTITTINSAVVEIERFITSTQEEPADNSLMAEGVLGGLLVGFQMDRTSFLAVHADDLSSLTNRALTADATMNEEQGDFRSTAEATILAAIMAENEIAEPSAQLMAPGILAGLIAGYDMSPASFRAIHGKRLAHLTRLALKAVGREVTANPGDLPRNI